MKKRLLLVILFSSLLAACAAPVSLEGEATAIPACRDPLRVVEAFYNANDAGDAAAALKLVTEDAALVFWAEGANGHHVSYDFAVGKDNLAAWLAKPGLRRAAAANDRPSFHMEKAQADGNVVRFMLMPDRLRENGRPFNHYAVEMVFNGCQIEIIKVVERVTWL